MATTGKYQAVIITTWGCVSIKKTLFPLDRNGVNNPSMNQSKKYCRNCRA
jgi:hypothetical protein